MLKEKRSLVILGVWFLVALFSLVLVIGKTAPKISTKLISFLPSIGEKEEPKSQDFGLIIPKLNINTPILADVNGYNEKEYYLKLANGVAHFKGTAKPSDSKGNIFIFGHSGFLKNAIGDYKEIFKNLDQLNKEESIIVWYKGEKKTYKVVENKVVKDDDLSVLEPTKDLTLTLMTCWPPGTIAKRRVVVAKPI